ncbi:ankyrin [Neocallimastix lanati (nom. inval.)]|nr:ankyrin [Neocallimastix sp. JGI-2020a]
MSSSNYSDSKTSEDERLNNPKKSTIVNKSYKVSSTNSDLTTSEDEKFEKPKKSTCINESCILSSYDSDSSSEDEKFEEPKKSTFINESYITSSSDLDSSLEDEKFEKPKKSTFINESYITSSSDLDSSSEDEKFEKPKKNSTSEDERFEKPKKSTFINKLYITSSSDSDSTTSENEKAKKTKDAHSKEILKIIKKYVYSSDNMGNTALMNSCEYGRTAATKFLIDNKADIKKRNKKNQTAFILAVMNQRQNIVDYLINLNIDIYVQDSYGNTALHYACINNDIYFDYGVDLKFKNSKTGNNILMQSILSNKTKISEFIINQTTIIEDILMDKNLEGKTVLNQIVENSDNVLINYIFHTLNFSWIKVKILNLSMINNHEEFVSSLLQDQNQIININEKDDDGKYPLFVAIRQKNETFVKLLIDYANTNNFNMNINEEEGYTPLTLSYELNCKNIFEYLVKQDKIDKNQNDLCENQCILYYAIKNEDESTVEKLITYNVNVNLVNNEDNEPKLRKLKELINLIIQKGSNVDSLDKQGNSLLFYANENENEEVIKLLIENNVNLNKNTQNVTIPLNIAIKKNNIKIVQLLVNSGANINISESSSDHKVDPPIIVAYNLSNENSNNFEIYNYLLEKGANCNVKDKNGSSLLLLAILNSSSISIKSTQLQSGNSLIKIIKCKDISTIKKEKLINALIKKGININSVDKNGNTSVIYAIKKRNPSILKILIEKGADLSNKNNKDFEDRNQFGSFNGSCMSILLKAMKLELIDNNDNMKYLIKR